MSQTQPVQPHQQDDCEGCQKQRAQNNKLIDFYQRLHKIKTKVTQIKPNIANHAAAYKDQHQKLKRLQAKINTPPNIKTEINQYDSKQMGYQLTCALLERQIKMKRQNQVLSQRVKDFKNLHYSVHGTMKKLYIEKKDSQMQSQPQQQFYNPSGVYNNRISRSLNRMKQTRGTLSDSIDNALEDNNKSFWASYQISPVRSQRGKQQNSRYSEPFDKTQNNKKDMSTFQSFQQTGREIFNPTPVQQQIKNKFNNLNLWLYQYEAGQQIFSNSKTKVNKNKRRK